MSVSVGSGRMRHLRGLQGDRLPIGRLVVVQEWQRLVRFRRGALVRTLGPGGYRHWRRQTTGWLVDVRPWILPIPAQEVPTSEGVSVKVSVVVQTHVTDPEVFVTASQDPTQVAYLLVQIALRDLVSRTSIEELLGGRAAATAQLAAAVSELASVGMHVDRVEIKDIVLPADLKRAQSEILIARAHGQAALERARAESAALRSLANAAKLAADNPMLIELRLIQQLEGSSGHTIVMGPGRSAVTFRPAP